MASSKLLASLSFIKTLILLCSKTVVSELHLYHVCLNSSDHYTSNSSYQANLNDLLSDLSNETTATGFSMGSKGEGPDRVHGLAQCRPDIEPSNCTSCVNLAISESSKFCPFNKGAVLWYDHCHLKYSDTEFFSKVDDEHWYCMQGSERVNGNSTLFDENAVDLLNEVAEEACGKPEMSALRSIQLEGSDSEKKLFGLVQCTRDLSKEACKSCLTRSISLIPNCCSGNKYVRLFSATCDVIQHVV